MKKTLLISLLSFLAIVGTAKAFTHVINSGETLSLIAKNNNTTVEKLVADNNIADKNLIYVGDSLEINEGQNLGANLPTVVALFETSLASKISSSQTTMTLVSALTKDGTTLSGTYGLIIDESLSSEEFVLATCSGTSCSAMRRGLSVIDGWTEITALKFEHRRGASVKLTSYPQLAIISRILDGTTTTPAILLADASLSNSSLINNQYATVGFVTSYVAGGFSSLNVGTLYGLKALGTSPETVGINLHNQSGLKFETTTGKLQVATTTESATGLTIRDGVLKIATTTDIVWTGNHIFSGTFQNTNATTTGKLNVGYTDLGNATSTLNVKGDISLTGNILGGALKFGGDGSDGALSVTSATTTIDLGGHAFVDLNYTSVSITGGHLTFSNANASGTTVFLRSQGNVTITCSEAACIDGTGFGAAGGAAPSGVGDIGKVSTQYFTYPTPAQPGTTEGSGGAGGGAVATSTGMGLFYTSTSTALYQHIVKLVPASGGAGGGKGDVNGGTAAYGGAGGAGGIALYVECAGSLNFTGTIYAKGVAGSAGASSGDSGGGGGGGGGGAGGWVVILYNSLTSKSGTITVTGGAGGTYGTSSNTGQGGAGGGGGGSVVGAGTNGATHESGGYNGGAGGAGNYGWSFVDKNIWF